MWLRKRYATAIGTKSNIWCEPVILETIRPDARGILDVAFNHLMNTLFMRNMATVGTADRYQ